MVALNADEDFCKYLIGIFIHFDHNLIFFTLKGETDRQKFNEAEKSKLSNVLNNIMLNASENVDVCFLVDCTGSMDPYIDNVKTIIKEGTNRLKKVYTDLKLRISFVGYRDYEEMKDHPDRITVLPFTTNSEEFFKFVDGVKAGGGTNLLVLVYYF